MLQQEIEVKKDAKEKTFNDFFGVFEDVDADTMIKDIEEARTTKEIDISWVK